MNTRAWTGWRIHRFLMYADSCQTIGGPQPRLHLKVAYITNQCMRHPAGTICQLQCLPGAVIPAKLVLAKAGSGNPLGARASRPQTGANK